MVMAAYKYGKPVMVNNNPAVAYSAGDVVVIGNTPFVAHEDNPAWSGNSLTPDAFAAGGGVYTIPADAAYAVGTDVLWNTSSKKVTTVPAAGLTFPFGFIVGGPNGNLNDGGPTGSGSLCDVFHMPVQPPNSVLPATQYTSISSGNGTLTGAQVAGAAHTSLLTSGATALTTPTAAAILAAIPDGGIGSSYILRIVNTNGGTLTITADASVTATGTLTLATNTWREWYVTITGATTATMKQIGTGTTS